MQSKGTLKMLSKQELKSESAESWGHGSLPFGLEGLLVCMSRRIMNLRLSCIHDCKDAVFFSVSMIFLFLSFCRDGVIYFQNLSIFKGIFYKVMQLREGLLLIPSRFKPDP